jgi:hypothetical protein|nr:MAG TPA: hypothetical protein [Caudoviricetes sp.]
MTVTTDGYKLSDFKVDIFEEGDNIKVRVECFADDRTHMSFHLYKQGVIEKAVVSDSKCFYAVLARMITENLNGILTSAIFQPDPCECQDHRWFKTHPDDRQEYWRSPSGRIYPKTHTVNCPKSPVNRRKNNA